MARFVKEGAFGYKDVPGGQFDQECTHVILKLKEYDKLLQEKARAEQETRNTKFYLLPLPPTSITILPHLRDDHYIPGMLFLKDMRAC